MHQFSYKKINIKIFICKIVAILSWPHCVNDPVQGQSPRAAHVWNVVYIFIHTFGLLLKYRLLLFKILVLFWNNFISYFDELVQERCNSIANALELHLSCTNPWILSTGDGFLRFCFSHFINDFKYHCFQVPYPITPLWVTFSDHILSHCLMIYFDVWGLF